MARKFGSLLFAVGLFFIAISIYQYVDHNLGAGKAMAEAEILLGHVEEEEPAALVEKIEVQEPVEQESIEDKRRKFTPNDHEVIGILQIPKIEAKLPIIEGTEADMLAKGVGHYKTTAFPTDDEQILLSGHRDTVFRNFDQLEVGDRFIVELPYGTFEYEMRETEIVDEDDTTVIRPMGEEVLTLTTCYPFRYLGNAPQRYIIYAYPVIENKTSRPE